MKNEDIFLRFLDAGYCGNSTDPKGFRSRNYYSLHQIAKGRGLFFSRGKQWILSEGQCFLLHPDTEVEYRPPEGTQWNHYLLHFSPSEQARRLLSQTAFSPDNPIVDGGSESLELMQKIAACPHTPVGRIRAEGYLHSLLAYFVETFPAENLMRSMRSISPLFAYIRNNVYRPDLNVAALSELAGVSRVTLYRKFKTETGYSPTEYIRRHRLDRALQLLLNTELNISEIAYAVGYTDPLYFSKLFTERFGMSPSKYRIKRCGKK